MLIPPNVNGTVLNYLIELTQLYSTELGYNAVKGCFTLTFIGIEDVNEDFELVFVTEYMDFIDNNTGLVLDLYVTNDGIVVINNNINKMVTIEPSYILSYDIDTGISTILRLLGIQQSMCIMCTNIVYEEEIKIINTIIAHVRGAEFTYMSNGYIDGGNYINLLTYRYGLDSDDYLSIAVEYDDTDNTYCLYAKANKNEIEYKAAGTEIIKTLSKFIVQINNFIQV